MPDRPPVLAPHRDAREDHGPGAGLPADPLAEPHGGGRLPLVAAVVLAVATAVAATLLVPGPPLGGAAVPPPDPALDFTAEQVARGDALGAALRLWNLSALALSVALAAVLGLTPLGARLVRAVGRPVRGRPLPTAALGAVLVVAVPGLAVLPLRVGASRKLREVGLTTQPWGAWLLDQLQGLAVRAVAVALLVLLVVALARRLPRAWSLPAAAGAAVLVVVGSLVHPLVVAPLFATTTPLPAGEQRAALLRLADEAGVPVSDVLVADASRRTTGVNASVSGLGGTRRLVVYDTLLRDAPQDEVEAVVAHELGHVRARDVAVGTTLGALGTATGVLLLGVLLRRRALLRRAGATGPGDPRVVPLVVLLALVGQLLALPLANAASRRVEARADVVALEVTRDPAAVAALQRRLAVTNVADLTPPPLLALVFGTHPPAAERLALVRAWAAREGLPVPPPVDAGPGS